MGKERWEGVPRLWPDPNHGPWEVILAWTRLESGRQPCVGVRLRWAGSPGEEPQELSSTLLRSIPLGTMIARQRMSQAAYHAHLDQVTSWLEQNPKRRRGSAPPAITDAQVETARRRLEGRRGQAGRPPTRGVEFYATVATIYSEAYRRGENPTLAVTTAHRRLGVKLSRSGAAKAVAKTRRLGLLGPAEKGKAGGMLPPKKEKS